MFNKMLKILNKINFTSGNEFRAKHDNQGKKCRKARIDGDFRDSPAITLRGGPCSN